MAFSKDRMYEVRNSTSTRDHTRSSRLRNVVARWTCAGSSAIWRGVGLGRKLDVGLLAMC